MANVTKFFVEGNTYPVKEQLKALGCRWDGDRRAWYAETQEVADKAKAIVKPKPLYNSPPPQDLGTVDPVELAAKFGRKAVDGAKVTSQMGYGKEPSPLGTVVHFKQQGIRRVKVANGKPRYFSRDMLEDFDMFSDEPGWQYQWDGVEVEPTAEELAEDQVVRDAADRVTAAKLDIQTAKKAIREGEKPEGTGASPEAEVGAIRVNIGEGQTIYGGGEWFVITSTHIWHVTNNGSDGGDWSYNNVRTGGAGAIGFRVPFDAELAAKIRAAAKLLGYAERTNKGEPARTRIATEHGVAYQSSNNGTRAVVIDWTPSEPIGGHAKLSGGERKTVDGEDVVQFWQQVKKGKKTAYICPRIAGRPELAELVELAAQLKAELDAHFGEEEDD